MMKAPVVLLLFSTVFLAYAAAYKRFDNYKLVEVVPTSDDQLNFLKDLARDYVHIDFWRPPSFLHVKTTMMMSAETFDDFEKFVDYTLMPYEVVNHNLQQLVEEEQLAMNLARSNVGDADSYMDLNTFNNLTKIYDWLDTLPAKCPKTHTCQVYSVGESYQKTPIKAFKIMKPGSNRKSWYLDATTHAREWITTATILKIIDHLVLGKNADAKELIEKYDFYFIPIVNPDGYNFTFLENRMWRKNRRPTKAGCFGVDLNRNFAATNWGKEGSSSSECSETYKGPSAGSEPETTVVSNELKRIASHTIVMLTMHSYGNMYMLPFGNTINYTGKVCERSKDHDELMVGLNKMADATQATYNTKWLRGNGCEVIYPTTGSTDDYTKDKLAIKYSICAELRGKSFVILPSEIEPSFREVFNGIVALSRSIKY
ncbi:hypothetical protein HELRODRAFT_185234 [Helobdella robusta]|uniref:Peptidase M14 domain-containing protein n=1 Tax=Helobdella robusta TaxID=6412 RepID=T1FMJ5_HELRO|nr:hypothetical protein HELRODRAFT_185234 [Helobdella robusta]ESO11534.1 hypothetical protein HELRODRAFT_185234 [Helobdella robusta]